MAYHVGPAPAEFAAADLNGDGKLDLAVTDVTGKVFILLGKGDGTFGAPVAHPVGTWSAERVVDARAISWLRAPPTPARAG